jgi:hypothetical protein
MVAITPDSMAQLTDLALLRVFDKLNIFTDMTILSGWSDNDSIFAVAQTIEQDEKLIQSIKYSVPAYVGNYKWMTTFFDEVTHEMTHAVMQYYLGNNLLSAPPWWREGIALQCAWPQGPTRGFIYYVIHNYNIDDIVKGLGPDVVKAECYPEAYYALDAFIKKWGWDGVRKVNEKVMDGAYFSTAIEEVTGLVEEQFYALAAQYAIAELSKLNVAKQAGGVVRQLKR